ncbi:hypothetical protein C7974DRAFT_451166 [Boeremia exigua]|uniref:uncharacterized protein n=1 Tax=Boeremia exigua TaxID=749465 RepID=UPI001E8D6676|nr:uncharacterized protein C7974DRAFT_451166 [Boeremia exigua]KAH6637962.1 hypothetical protein C7974DRAFT_451166 [Boeremia exigua]
MTTTRPAPTTTYTYYETTYTNLSPITLSSYPTTYTDTTWLPPITADTLCASATAYPSIEGPLGLKAGCVISNAAEINPNAFWDVYDCCPGHDLSSYGYSSRGDEESSPGICMMQCIINDDTTTWQQVGECLQKRVKEVVCAPKYEERDHNATYPGAEESSLASVTVSTTQPGGAGDASRSASAAGSTGAAAIHDAVHASTSRLGLFAFSVLAVASAVGIFL